ncbi:MAG: hypothetical protein ACI85O_001348 [Saprospiraceae bacterium]|jgi:hypothetical protein
MRLADTDNPTARSLVEVALNGGIFENNADDFSITYYDTAPNTNPLHATLVLSGRNDFVPANTTIDIMNALEDPRRALWFDMNGLSEYIGGIYGSSVTLSSVSGFGSIFGEATLPGVLFSYSETQFLLAEAGARGYVVGGTTEEFYNEGITSSILEWGGSQVMADTYLAQTGVAYSTASGDWKAKIGKQKWLSLFNNGMEGWTTWRLFDLDFFTPPPGLDLEDILVRFVYPIDEATLNPRNYDTAASNYDGDSVRARLFWDVN